MKKRTLIICVFLTYCAALTAVLFFRKSDGLGIGIATAIERLKNGANLVPFDTVERYHRAYSAGSMRFVTYFLNIYGNILLFLPMGIMLPKLFPKVRRYILFLAVLSMTVLAELTQLLIGVGRFDIDDIILNLAGAALPLIILKKHRRRS